MNLTLVNIKRTSSPEVHYRITYSAELLKDEKKADDLSVVIDIGPLGRQYHVNASSISLNEQESEKVVELMKDLYAKNKLP